jgi:hypothetical protein
VDSGARCRPFSVSVTLVKVVVMTDASHARVLTKAKARS